MAYESTSTKETAASSGAAIPLDKDNQPRIKKLDKKRRQQEIGKTLSEFLIRISNQISDTDRERRLKLFRNMIKAHKYADNEFFGYVDQNMSWVEARKDSPDEVWYTNNELFPYFRTAMMEMSRTQTEVLVTAATPGNAKLEAAAKFAKARVDSIREKTLKPRLKQTENSYAFLNGITFRYTFAQFSDRGEKVPIMEERESDKQSVKLCANCFKPQTDVSGDLKDILDAEYVDAPEKCVHCGSTMFDEHEIDLGADVVIGYKNIASCENKWIVPNPIGVIVSMQADSIQTTPYIKWNLLVHRSALEHKYEGIEIPSTGTISPELRYVANQQVSSPNGQTGLFGSIGDTGGMGEKELELIEYQQHWLDYEMYCDATFPEDMPLSNGKTLKAGKPLGPSYPNGLYYARVGDAVLDMWNEDKNRKWTSSPYGLRPGSMYGSGCAVAMSDQELLNDLRRLIMANAWANGVPREFVDESLIPEISADPTIPTRVMGDGTMKKIVGTAYDIAPAQPLSAEIYKLEDNARSSMQNATGAMSGAGAGGLADAQKWGDTATAISIKRDLAVGRFSPDLELMADQLDCEQAKQFNKNEQQYYTEGQWQRIMGDHDSEGLEAFLKCDIDHDLNYTVAEGSHMPKSDAQVQSKLVGLSQLLPALAQANSPELLNYAFEVFGVPRALGGWNSDRAQAQRVVDRFMGLSQLFIEEYGDLPTNSLEDPAVQQAVMSIEKFAQMPVDVFLDNHEALVDSFRDLRSTDAGRAWPNIMTAAIAGRVMQHRAAVAKQEAMMNNFALAAQKPLKDAADAEAAKVAEANAAAEAEATQLQVADKVMEYNDRDEQRKHALQQQENEHEQQARLKLAELAAASDKSGTAAPGSE